jgi:dienelactone hydrolase
VTFHVYDGTGHPFANEEDPFGTYDADAAALAWTRTLALLDAHL